MALVQCPDCGKEISDAAPSCIGCGRPMASNRETMPRAAGGRSTVREPSIPATDWKCERCGGTSFKKYSLLYEENRSLTTTRTVGAGAGVASGGRLGVGLGGAKSKGVNLTDLARRVAPPDKTEMAKDDPVGGIVLGVGTGVAFLIAVVAYFVAGLGWATILFMVALFGSAILSGRIAAPDIDRQYRRAYAEWDRKYMCLSCGSTKLAER